MAMTGTYVSLSRQKIGPEADVQHRPRSVDQIDQHRYVASCICGWRSGKRRAQLVAVDSLLAHIDAES